MNPVGFVPFIAAPRVLADGARGPRALARLTFLRLCQLARLPPRVSSPHEPRVILHAGTEHFLGRGDVYVGIGGPFDLTPLAALRVLEVLAHAFHDYGARECICGRGLFVAPTRRGRPSLAGRPMTPAERMRRKRQRALAGPSAPKN